MKNKTLEKKRIILSLLFPLLFVFILWVIKVIEVITSSDFAYLGLYPLRVKGLFGIITSPFIHGDWKHLINNSVPLLVFTWSIFYFYKEVAYKVFFLIWIISGLWLWFFARDAYHIGASGLIYGFGSFLFFSGIFRRNKNLLAISLLITFLYGGMVWGIFPMEERVSWESHLLGTVAGIILAIYYKNIGPPLPKTELIDIYDEEEIEDEALKNYKEHMEMMKKENKDEQTWE